MNILFITSNRIGDAVLSTGLIRHLTSQYPNARWTIACGPAAAPLFRAHPGLENLHMMTKAKRGGHWWQLWQKTYRKRWDLTVDLRRSLISFVLWSRKRKILARPGNDTHRVIELAQTFGLEENPPAPKIWLDQEAITQAEAALCRDGRKILGVGPTANWGGKIWPPERFAELIKSLTAPGRYFENARIALFAGPNEKNLADQLRVLLPPESTIDLVGKLDLLATAAALASCDGYIGNDSGLMHMAAAMNIPTLGLFGPSKPELYAPWGENCASVRTDLTYDQIINAPDYDFRSQVTRMSSLSVDKVLAVAIKLFGHSNSIKGVAGK